MKRDDRWLEVLRNRLKDHSVQPSDDLWQKIQIDLEKSSPVPNKVVPLWPRIAAAAAAIVLIGGGGWMYFSRSLEKTGTEIQKRQTTLAAMKGIQPKINRADDMSAGVSTRSKLLAETSVVSQPEHISYNVSSGVTTDKEREPVVTETTTDSLATETESADKRLVAAVSSASTNSPAEGTSSETSEAESEVNKPKPQNWYDHIPEDARKEMAENTSAHLSSKENRWSISLTAMNGLPSVGGNVGGTGVVLSAMSNAPANLRPFGGSLADEYVALSKPMLTDKQQTKVYSSTTSVKHKVPVSYGASFRYNLTKRWGIESGVAYTILSSTFATEGTGEVSYNQNLHYLEVPVRVGYTFLNQRWFSVYTAVGGAVAKCVYAKVDDDESQSYSLNEKPWQFSVSGAAGIQLNVVDHVGIYVEPGIGYYFKDNSSLRTVYKDHPWVFKLNFGFRLSY